MDTWSTVVAGKSSLVIVRWNAQYCIVPGTSADANLLVMLRNSLNSGGHDVASTVTRFSASALVSFNNEKEILQMFLRKRMDRNRLVRHLPQDAQAMLFGRKPILVQRGSAFQTLPQR